jgi:hypothetical protein
MQQQFYNRGKKAIFVEDHVELKSVYKDAQNIMDYNINISDLFIKLLYSACFHNRKNTIIFLFQCYFDIFTDTQRIALRQSFFYGKYQIKNEKLIRWYSDSILPIIKCY